MIVYRSNNRPIIPHHFAAAIRRRAQRVTAGAPGTPDERRALLIEAGELEAAVVDQLCESIDASSPVERACRAVTIAAARAVIDGPHAGQARVVAKQLQALCHAIDSLCEFSLPSRAWASRPEGYAYYCVYPEAYAEAAAEVVIRQPAAAGTPMSVIGLRSIGTSLAGVVAAELERRGCRVESWTVRPRGHPFDRRISLDSDLADQWRARAPGCWIIVDEGPGLSGSSLAAAAVCLTRLHVPADSVILMPNYTPDLTSFAEQTAAVWRQHLTVPAACERLGRWPAVAGGLDVDRAQDGSGGRWRTWVFSSTADYPAVHPAHERRKWRIPSAAGAVIVKFAGLGRHGARVADRASCLADAGWSPPIEAVSDGFLRCREIIGAPLASAVLDCRVLDRLADYLAWVADPARHAAVAVDGQRVEDMASGNVHEVLGDDAHDRVRRALDRTRSVRAAQPFIRLDGRMRPHEWIDDGRVLLKTDGYEHDDDHFFPGPYDIAWDVAATIHEFDLNGTRSARVIDRYVRLTGDRSLAARLPVITAMYLAARAGYTGLAASALAGTEDGERMQAAHNRYRAALGQAVDRL